MAILKVARMGHPVLRTTADPLTRSQIRSTEVQRLIDDMIETMHEYEGVGLAAPQVHHPWRLTVIEVPASPEAGSQALELTVLINPVVTLLSDERVLGWEGCLSLPDLRGFVPRAPRVRVEALDRHARPLTIEAQDFSARVIQHECDHLDGILYVDRMQDLKTLSFIAECERFQGAEAEAVED
jgi:peptide deformylase